MTTSSFGDRYDTCREMSFIAVSPIMRKLYDQVSRVAAIDEPVLCLGESGTGKEVVSRLIHTLSPRANGTFLKVNCATSPPDLPGSELFGYEPGAFTGAVRANVGKLELCQGGTILLDEITEIPTALQTKLLHVFEDHTFTRLGGRSRIRVDVRIIAAADASIEMAVASKTLRQDLYYRLSTVILRIPPLRERREDIPVLLEYFMRRCAVRHGAAPKPITPALLALCNSYSWPGNVRELENFVQRYLILDAAEVVLKEQFRSKSDTHPPAVARLTDTDPATGPTSPFRSIRDRAERTAIESALEQTNWNRRQAARLLQVSYKTLLNKIRQYRLGPSR